MSLATIKARAEALAARHAAICAEPDHAKDWPHGDLDAAVRADLEDDGYYDESVDSWVHAREDIPALVAAVEAARAVWSRVSAELRSSPGYARGRPGFMSDALTEEMDALRSALAAFERLP